MFYGIYHYGFYMVDANFSWFLLDLKFITFSDSYRRFEWNEEENYKLLI